MLPLRDPAAETGHDDDVREKAAGFEASDFAAAVADWDLSALGRRSGFVSFADFERGMSWEVEGGDVVTAAPELARLTLNVAMAHHDRRAGIGGSRLVYGGHAIGLAAAQATRALPDLATIVGWHGCDHLAPVFEADTLTSEVELERSDPLPNGGGLLHLRSRVNALRAGSSRDDVLPVLDWRFIAVHP